MQISELILMFVHFIGGKEYSLQLGGFEENYRYKLKINKKTWQEKDVLQNSVFLVLATYEENPHDFIRHKKNMMTVDEIVAVGEFTDAEKNNRQLCIIGVDKARDDNRMSTLYIAFTGSQTTTDWKANLDFTLTPDEKLFGKVHHGFSKRSELISPEEIYNLADFFQVQRVITCGHSLGGAVSSLVHLNFIDYMETNNIELKTANLTFGAPLFGNERLWRCVKEDWKCNQMFHFVAVEDLVPALLSLGNTVQHLKNAILPEAAAGFVRLISTLSTFASGFMGFLTETNLFSFENRETIQQFLSSFKQLQNSTEASTLFNDYCDNQYVPIGQFVFLLQQIQEGQFDHQAGDPKIIERILTSIEQHVSKNKSKEVVEIKSNHAMKNYGYKLKHTFVFKEKARGSIGFAKKDFFWRDRTTFEFRVPWQLVCGFQACEECDRKVKLPHQNESLLKMGVLFCKTCHESDDQRMLEPFFHNGCWYKFHTEREGLDDHFKEMVPTEILMGSGEGLTRYFEKLTKQKKMRIDAPKKLFSLCDLCPFGFHWLWYMRNEISREELFNQMNIGMVSIVLGSGISTISAFAISGVLVLSPLGLAVTVLAGLAGTVVLQGILNMGVNIYSQSKERGRVADSEEELKATQIAEAIILMNIYEPNIRKIELSQIRRHHRELVLTHFDCHEDRLPEDAPKEERLKGKQIWQAINGARDILVTTYEHSHLLSDFLVNLIRKKVVEHKRMKISEFVAKHQSFEHCYEERQRLLALTHDP